LPLPEKALIERIRRHARIRASVIRGIGDDSAVLQLPRGQQALVTTDFSLEGIHFRREWHPPNSVGHRCLARGLSDIAAMGGQPIAAFLSLALPRKLPQSWVDGFLDGLLALASQHHVVLAGGDIAESPAGVLADISVLGSVPARQAILRSGAKPGHWIFVTGALGEAAAVLQKLFSDGHKQIAKSEHPRHFYPAPRIEVGIALRRNRIPSAMIDLSDGLSTDLAHICEESAVGAQIEAVHIPRAVVGKAPVDLQLALHGGDDYELLFTARPGTRVPARLEGVPITRIGTIIRQPGIRLLDAAGNSQKISPQGWEHFRGKSK
jgi:thiamine-monophosphate kinase